jgi:hypothetical protein
MGSLSIAASASSNGMSILVRSSMSRFGLGVGCQNSITALTAVSRWHDRRATFGPVCSARKKEVVRRDRALTPHRVWTW